ncbi:junctional sarcoplasmic reticulum protein 1 isoform X2 [Sciurus carolinensis]|uniref:junctional sarcoplasmic reticulum protein 1 isoform X2 n=1 Tax=Sciurus carolinensis TaxID=30640 RepID=UPI001FB295B0|nr:junctional sarcoplasmic reticulum protein 1 isoform X2 [Sciurus carolinensis]
MTTRALEELDGGLGSCLASEDLSTLADPCPGRPPGDKPPETPRLGNSSTWLQDSQEAVAEGNAATKPKKMEKEPVVRGSPGAGKEKLKSGPTPRSVPARKKVQALPPPPPPPVLSEELPWGDLSLNKCLVLASLVALLGSAFQLCRDAVTGEGTAPTPAPERWVPRGSPPKEPVSSLAGPPALQGKTEDSPRVSMTKEVAEKAPGEPGEATREAAGKERAPPVDRGPKERPRKEGQRKEERPPKEKVRKEKPRKVERPQKERPRVAREAREALPRRWEAREGGHRPWAPDSRDPEHRKRQAWAPRRHPDMEKDRHPGEQKHRAGKGRG